jgi:hypothetical protein
MKPIDVLFSVAVVCVVFLVGFAAFRFAVG